MTAFVQRHRVRRCRGAGGLSRIYLEKKLSFNEPEFSEAVTSTVFVSWSESSKERKFRELIRTSLFREEKDRWLLRSLRYCKATNCLFELRIVKGRTFYIINCCNHDKQLTLVKKLPHSLRGSLPRGVAVFIRCACDVTLTVLTMTVSYRWRNPLTSWRGYHVFAGVTQLCRSHRMT